jgi:hypothetical protein
MVLAPRQAKARAGPLSRQSAARHDGQIERRQRGGLPALAAAIPAQAAAARVTLATTHLDITVASRTARRPTPA